MVGCSIAVDENGLLTESDFNEFSSDIKFIEISNKNKNKIKGTQIGKIIKSKGYL